MSVLLLVEHDGSAIKDSTLAAVTAAAKLGDVHALVAGSGVGGVGEAAAKIAGVSKVLLADAPHLSHDLAENVAPVAAKLMANYDALVAPASTFGKNIAPRVAALLDVMQLSDILSVESADTFTRPTYAGNAIATVRSSDSKLVLTVRGTAFEKADRTGGSGGIEAVASTGDKGMSSFVGAEIAKLGFTVITGGGPGIMEAGNRGAHEAGGRSIGVNIELPFEQHLNPYVDRSVTMRYFFTRKTILIKYSYAFIVLPGGAGTLDEMFETMTLIQTGKIRNFPIILMGKDYWQPLMDFVYHMAEAGTISPADPELIFFTDDVGDAIAHLQRHAVRQFGLRRQKLPKPSALFGEKPVVRSAS